MLELMLPYPPSVNNYWRSARSRHGVNVHISEAGKKFRAHVYAAVIQANAVKRYPERLNIEVKLYPADARKRDIDNCLKALLDALACAGVYLDDEQVDRLTVTREHKVKGGACLVRISKLDAVD